MQGSYLSPAIRIELEGDGARYVLSPRRLGWFRHLGWIPVGLGAGIGIVVVSVVAGFVAPLLEDGLPPVDRAGAESDWILLAVAAVGGLVGLSIAFRVLRFGLFVVAGHSEVLLRAGRLVGIERGGWLWRSRRVRASEVRALRIADALPNAGAARPGATPIAGAVPSLARLEARLESGRALPLAVGYPAEELELLARDLAERIPSSVALSGGALAPAPAVERVDREAGSGSEREAPLDPAEHARREAERRRRTDRELAARPPAGCPIELERTGAGLVVRVPPAGLIRGSHGLFAFGFVWIAFVLVFAAVFVAAELGGRGNGDLGPLGALALLSLFAAIGVGMLWFGARAGTRRTTIEVSPPLVRVATVAFGRVKEETHEVRELRAISVGPSGVRVNNRDILELELHRSGGRKRGLLRERRTEELEWLAALLRAELALPADAARAASNGS